MNRFEIRDSTRQISAVSKSKGPVQPSAQVPRTCSKLRAGEAPTGWGSSAPPSRRRAHKIANRSPQQHKLQCGSTAAYAAVQPVVAAPEHRALTDSRGPTGARNLNQPQLAAK